MKKIVFTLIAFSSLMVLSCRQQEEMMDSEDLKSLSVLKEATNKTKSIQNIQISDTIIIKKAEVESSLVVDLDFESTKPPK